MDFMSHLKLRLRFPNEDVVHFSQLFDPFYSVETISSNLQYLTLILPELPSRLNFSCIYNLSTLFIAVNKISPEAISESKINTCTHLTKLHFEADMNQPIMCSKCLIKDIQSPLNTFVVKNTSVKSSYIHKDMEEEILLEFWENALNATKFMVSLHDIFTYCCAHRASELLDTMFYFCKLPQMIDIHYKDFPVMNDIFNRIHRHAMNELVKDSNE